MNPDVLIPCIGVVAIALIVENTFKPRLDITENNDLIMWYFNRKGERVFIILWHLH